MGLAARERFQQFFSLDRYLREVQQLYDQAGKV